jgi:hypothetical protein
MSPRESTQARSARRYTLAVAVAGSLALLAAVAPTIASAQQSPLTEVRVGAGRSDNITRDLDAAAKSATWLEAGLTGDLRWNTTRIESRLSADATYRRYDGSYGDEVVGGANASLRAKILERRFEWVAEDFYAQTQINSFAPDAPQNRQGTNYIATGPDFFLPLGARTRAFANARWAQVSYDTQLLDSTRRSGSVGLERQVSPLTTVRLAYSGTRVEFDDRVLNPDIDGRDVTVGMHREGPRSTLDGEVGHTKIDTRGESKGALLVRLGGVVRFSPMSSLRFGLGREYSDSGEFFRLQQNDIGPVGPLAPGTQSSDPLTSTYGNMTWARGGARMTFSVGADVRRDRRQRDTFLDVNRTGAETAVDYRLSPRTDAGVRLRFTRAQLVETGAVTRDTGVGVSLRWMPAARVRVTLLAERVQGEYGVAGSTFHENRASIVIGYAGRR